MAENGFQKTTRRGRIFRYAPLAVWVGVIFFLSSGEGSAAQTSRFIGPLLEFLFPAASAELLQSYHAFVRKFAHFFEYAVLAFFAWRALRGSAAEVLRKYRHAISLALVVLVAALDETNQSFNPARTSSGYDVLLDAAGGLAMLSAIFVWENFQSRRRPPD